MCKTTIDCIFAFYFLQILFIAIGILLLFLFLISRNKTIKNFDKDGKEVLEQTSPPPVRIRDWELNFFLTREVRIGLLILSGLLFLTGFIWIVVSEIYAPLQSRVSANLPAASSFITPTATVIQMTQRESMPGSGVSLVSMKYTSGGWNPHMIDLRTASSSGIPAGATLPLKFSEIIVFAPPDLAGFQIWAEFLANGNEKIGETPVSILQPGLTSLEDVKIADAYLYLDSNTGKYSNDSWDVLKSWDNIAVDLKYKGASGQSGSTIWTIRLNQMGGTAWWNPPPDVNIVSVVYSVSGGIQQVLDLRREPDPVINAKAGDWITIHKVWYKANLTTSNQTMFVGGSINNGQQELNNKSSDMMAIREGIHPFENFTSMTWVLSSDIKWLNLIVIRSDDIVLDGYIIEISDTEKSGLVSAQKVLSGLMTRLRISILNIHLMSGMQSRQMQSR